MNWKIEKTSNNKYTLTSLQPLELNQQHIALPFTFNNNFEFKETTAFYMIIYKKLDDQENYQVAKCLIDWNYIQLWLKGQYGMFVNVLKRSAKTETIIVNACLDVIYFNDNPVNDLMPSFKPILGEKRHNHPDYRNILEFRVSNMGDNGIDLVFDRREQLNSAGTLSICFALDPTDCHLSMRDRPNLFMLRSSVAAKNIELSLCDYDETLGLYFIVLSNFNDYPVDIGHRYLQMVLSDHWAFKLDELELTHNNKHKKAKNT